MNDNSPDLHEGYIMLFRKVKDWGWYKDVNTFKLFIHMLIIANHKPKEWRGKLVERGCFISSTAQLAFGSGLTEQKVKTAVKHLISTHEIEKQSNSKFSYYKIVNYDYYQGVGHEEKDAATNKITNNQPASNQVVTTNNNANNEKMKIGIYKNVFLSKTDIANLQESFPNIDLMKCIDSFSTYINENPKYYSNNYKHFDYISNLITTGRYSFQKVKENDL